MADELDTLVVYDVPSDRLRTRVADACKDYGLDRFQYSAFRGPLDRNRREELFLRMVRTLGKAAGHLLVVALCAKDAASVLRHDIDAPAEEVHAEPARQ